MKIFKNKLAVTIIVLSVAFLGLIGFSVKQDSSSVLVGGVGAIFNPIQKMIYGVNDKVQDFLYFAFNFNDVRAENIDLRKENEELKSQLINLKDTKEENERFRELYNFTEDRGEYSYIGANIINIPSGSYLNSYTIDKGENVNLAKGMVVISNSGLVGQVSRVENNWAIVDTIINENIAVSVTVQSTRESVGILKGYRDGNNNLLAKIYNLPLDSEVKKGDIILTSGLGNIYPKGIKIGEVISVEEDKGQLMKIATVKPYVDFNRLEELFVVIPEDIRNIKY